MSALPAELPRVLRACTYSRKSTTDRAREGKSVADQLREARAEVDRRGWHLVKELADDGISASRFANGRSRPGFEEVLGLVEAGEVDVIVMAEQSRVTRSLAVLGALLETCAARGVLLVVGGTDVDPSRPEGFLMAGITGAVDAAESERTRARVMRGTRGGAVAGRPHGKNVYGYQRVYDPATRALLRVEPSPDAHVVVEIMDRLLTGESVRSVTADLNARGIPTPTGKGAWHHVTVRRLAMNPTYAALRVHRGAVVGPADWPALVTKERHLAVVARLSEAARVSTRPGAQRHLLSGTARCAVCGGPLRVLLDRRRPSYTCHTRGCFAVAIGLAGLNEYVSEAVVARLSRPDVAEALAASSGEDYQQARDELEALTARKTEIGRAMANGLDVSAAQVALEDLARQITDAQARLRGAVADPLLESVAGPGARDAWDRLSPEQRGVLARLVVKPVIHRSTRPRGARGFDPDRVELRWLH